MVAFKVFVLYLVSMTPGYFLYGFSLIQRLHIVITEQTWVFFFFFPFYNWKSTELSVAWNYKYICSLLYTLVDWNSFMKLKAFSFCERLNLLSTEKNFQIVYSIRTNDLYCNITKKAALKKYNNELQVSKYFL